MLGTKQPISILQGKVLKASASAHSTAGKEGKRAAAEERVTYRHAPGVPAALGNASIYSPPHSLPHIHTHASARPHFIYSALFGEGSFRALEGRRESVNGRRDVNV